MKAADASAGVIKSGGKTRRAAKMVVLNVDHPDIEDFVKCKVEEEKKAWALIEAGYDSSLDGPAYGSVFFQNANNSVRVTDEFMQAVQEDREWQTKYVSNGQVLRNLQGARPDANDRREHLFLRRSRHAVRYHDQRLAHLLEYRAHQRVQSLLGVHASGQLGVQSGVAQSAQVSARRRRVRHRVVPPRGRYRDLRPGHSDRQFVLSDRRDRRQRPRLSRARLGLCQSRCAC